MTLVKKVDSSWFPSEKPELAVGEVIDITDAVWLLKTGKVVAVDAKGEEVAPTDPVARVVYLERKLKAQEDKEEAKKKSQLENLAKAREARKSNG